MRSHRVRPRFAARNRKIHAQWRPPVLPALSPGGGGAGPPKKKLLRCFGWGGGGKPPPEPIALAVFEEDPRFQPRLGEFLDEKGVAIGLDDDLFHHFGGQHAPA